MSDRGPRFSHVGIFVQDIDRVAQFYQDVLDFIETDRGYLGEFRLIFLSRDPKEHHQIAFVSGLPAKPAHEVVNQISFRMPCLEELQYYARRARAAGASDFHAITHGNAWAIYCRDPEGNRIEMFVDSPWYISQPCREVFDLDRPAAEIMAETEAWCRTQPGFRPVADYQADLAQRIADRLAQRPAA